MRIREIIGRVTYAASHMWNVLRYGTKSLDETIPDYGFWDRFRRAQVVGFEIAGLFAAPITEIIAGWVFGATGLAVSVGNEYVDGVLADFMRKIRALLLNMVIDMYALGDQYVVINPDGTLSIASPETVEIKHDELDYRTIASYTITTKLDKATVTDEYRLDGRTVTIKWNDNREPVVAEYVNLIGMIPVIHFPNDRSGNESHGRPIYERLYRVFSRYDDLIEKMISGAEIMGNPIPTFEGMESIDETIEANSEPTEETWQDETGATHVRKQVAFDRLAAIMVGKGGSFKFAAPPVGFTNDIRNTLKSLFLMILETTRIPEAVWGNELSGANATAKEQMKTFHSFIEGRRLALAEPLTNLIDAWLRTMALTNRRIKVGLPIQLLWPDVSEGDAEMSFKWAEWAYKNGLITRATALTQSEMVEDVQSELDAADEEAAERKAQNDIEFGGINDDEEPDNGDDANANREEQQKQAA